MNTDEDTKLNPSPPYFWPDLRVVMEQLEYAWPVPFQSCIEEAKSVAGLVSPIDHEGCEWLRTMIEAKRDRDWNIILAVYGGCHTRERDLLDLMNLQENYESVNFKVKAFGVATAATTSMALIDNAGNVTIAIGNSPNFGFKDKETHHLNMVLNPEAILTSQWKSWFDWVWEGSAPLTNDSASIPALVPATGTPEAAAEWEEYLNLLSNTPSINWEVDSETGELNILDEDGENIPTISSQVGIPKANPSSIRVSEAIKKGKLVTVDKESRVPPFETPIPPELFGDKAQIQQGLISRRTQVKISPFDDKTLKDIENKRKSVTSLIARFSYPLADGVRWMPETAVEQFENEIESANSEGIKHLEKALGGKQFVDVKGFLEGRRPQIKKDAEDIFREVTGGSSLSESQIDYILNKMEERLEKTLFLGSLLPKFAFSHIELDLTDNGKWSSPWGQALSLTWHSAELCRKIYSKGLSVGQEEYAKSMDVFGDWIVRDADKTKAKINAYTELAVLHAIRDSEAPTLTKCIATLAIIDGKGEKIALDVLKTDLEN